MFSGFSDKDFAKLILSIENYDLSCKDLVNLSKDKGIPFNLVSSFVNIQRKEYDLPVVTHTDFRDILLDTVVSGNKYFFNSENLRLVLATMVVVYDGANTDIEYVSRIMKEVKKFLSFKISIQFNTEEYIKELSILKERW